MKKNDVIKLDITDVTLQGSGVGRADGIAVFVPGTVTGDTVNAHVLKVKSNYAFAKIDSVVKPSEYRVDEECASFSKCGGCAFRHVDYNFELELKENNVKNILKRIGGVEPIFEPIVGLRPNSYRNKCQYPVSKSKNGINIGFFSNHSHRVVDCPNCSLQPEEFSVAVRFFKEFIKKHNISVYDEALGTGLIRHLYLRKATVTDELMLCVVINGDALPFCDEFIENFKAQFGEKLKSIVININTEKTNVILGKKCVTLYGDDYITDQLCGVKVRISPLSFYQVNHDVAELLYKKAREYAEPKGKTVLDLYCGAGTIGLSMAKSAKEVIGVEIVPEAVEDAKFNAKNNGFSNTRFICDDAAGAAEKLKQEGIKPDVVIVDPPRKGCDAELIKIIAEDFAPKSVVYVSCDPATLARDCKIFGDFGYITTKATPFDMFPRTGHVEVCCCLSRK